MSIIRAAFIGLASVGWVLPNALIAQSNDAERRKDSLSNAESFMDINIGQSYIYLVDGLILSKDQFKLLELEDRDIKLRNLFSKEEGLALYGPVGKEGGKFLLTRKELLLNGVLVEEKYKVERLRQIEPSAIKSIRNLDSDQLKKEFGIKKKRGALVIETIN